MTAEILSIEVDDIEGEPEEGYTPSPSGQVKMMVNNKEIVFIVHEGGEIDLEGPSMSDEEYDLMWQTLNACKRVQAAFPADLY